MSKSSLRPHRNAVRALVIPCTIVAAVAGCGGGHHLAEYPFSSRTLAVVYIAPPSPVLLTSYYDLTNSQNPIEAVVRAGADVAREREGRRAQARLDSATARIDIPDVLAQRTLPRASR
jgi:NhaP-type Na+/H+ or K+/H+ antiporter